MFWNYSFYSNFNERKEDAKEFDRVPRNKIGKRLKCSGTIDKLIIFI